MTAWIRQLWACLRPRGSPHVQEALRQSESLNIEKRRMARFTREVANGQANGKVFVFHSTDFLDEEMFNSPKTGEPPQ